MLPMRRYLIPVFIILPLACGDGGTAPAPMPTSLAIIPPSATLAALGQTVQLTATVRDHSGAPMTGVTLNWATSDGGVATVTTSGLVTAVKNGSASVTVAVQGAGLSAAAAVTVAQQVSELRLAPASETFRALGDTLRLSAEALDATGNTVPDAAFTWSSSNESVVAVDESGLATAAGNGTATITANSGSVSGSAALTVTQMVSSVAVSPDADTLVAFGDTVRLIAEAADANGHAVAGAEFAWASGDTLVATVDGLGLVTAAGNGATTITATAGSASRSAAVVVEQEAITLRLNRDTVMFRALGDTLRLVAEAADANGYPVAVVWSSRDTTVAKVDAGGLVTATGNGAGRITAAGGGETVDVAVHVKQETAALAGLPAADTLLWYGEPGDTLRLGVEAVDANGYPVQGVRVEWSSSLSWVATVNANGLVRGVGEGVTTITATADSLRASTELAVVNRDRAILVALYHATGGPNWKRNEHWLTSPRMEDWQDVTVYHREDGVATVTGLDLFDNRLTGTAPPELWTLTSLEQLGLADHTLTGTIPPEIGNLVRLRELAVNIALTGPIPPEIGNLVRLERLGLTYGDLVGPIPPELGNLTRLEGLSLIGNRLTGTIPPELGRLSQLTQLNLAHNDLTGTIPAWLGSLPRLGTLWLGSNHFTGPIPSELGRLSGLTSLGLSHNELTGPIPAWLRDLPKLEFLSLGYNNLYGPIPPELGNLASLTFLGLGYNRLQGAIPSELANLARLVSLNFSENQLTGTIPLSLGDLVQLSSLLLDGNDLEGAIPSELANLARLELLTLSSNALSGPVPPELGNLANLKHLWLFDNTLTGQIPSSFLRLGALRDFWWRQRRGGDLCAPDTAAFHAWLARIGAADGGPICTGAIGLQR